MGRLPLLTGFLFLAALAAAAQSRLVCEQWHLLLLGGRRVGTNHQLVWEEDGGTFRTEVFQKMAVSRLGRSFTLSQSLIWIEGESLASVEAMTDLNGEKESLSARVVPAGIRVVQERQGARSERLLPVSGVVIGPYEAERRLAEAIRGPADSELKYTLFLPEIGKAAEVLVRILGARELRDSSGAIHRGILVQEESSAFPGIRTSSLYDAQGTLLFSITPVGLPLEMIRAEPGEAASQGFEDLPIFEMASFSIPVRWAGTAAPLGKLSEITLRFTGPAQAIAELERAAREAAEDLGGGYRILRRTEGLVLTIAAPEPPPGWPAPPAVTRATPPAPFTGGGFYLDLDDSRLEELRARCAPPSLACLEALVHGFISRKSLAYGFAGVSEILSTRSGDCTEHALLLAALLRKAGLASRLAYGFLLTEAGFIGHAWTEVRAAGRWLWLDPSFPEGTPYRFKLRLGVLDPAFPVWSQMGLSLLTVAGGVRTELLEAGLEDGDGR